MTHPRPGEEPGRGASAPRDAAPLDSELTSPTDPAAVLPDPERGPAAGTVRGRAAVVDGVLVLTGEIDGDLRRLWDDEAPAGLDVVAVDARSVTYLGTAGLALLSELSGTSAEPIPLWTASRAVLHALRAVGLDSGFDLHDPSSPTG